MKCILPASSMKLMHEPCFVKSDSVIKSTDCEPMAAFTPLAKEPLAFLGRNTTLRMLASAAVIFFTNNVHGVAHLQSLFQFCGDFRFANNAQHHRWLFCEPLYVLDKLENKYGFEFWSSWVWALHWWGQHHPAKARFGVCSYYKWMVQFAGASLVGANLAS